MYTYRRAATVPDEATKKRAASFVRRHEREVSDVDKALKDAFDAFKDNPCQGLIDMARKVAAGEGVDVQKRSEIAKALDDAARKLSLLVQEFENIQD